MLVCEMNRPRQNYNENEKDKKNDRQLLLSVQWRRYTKVGKLVI